MRRILAAARAHPVRSAALLVLAVQMAFTAAVRLVVVPVLLPASHWQYGLQQATDSMFFQQEAEKLTADARAHGAGSLRQEVYEGLAHTQLIAAVYYALGTDNPWSIYLLNAVFAACTVALLAGFGVIAGLPRPRAALLAAVLGCSPLFLFLHSELLREPFFVIAALLAWFGCLRLLLLAPTSLVRGLIAAIAGSIALAMGFVIATTLRPYLLLPMLGALGAALVAGVVWRLVSRSRGWGTGHLAMAASMALLTVFYVVPASQRVQQYADRGASEAVREQVDAVAAVKTEELKRTLQSSAPVVREAIVGIPHVCSVVWRPTGLPARVERALEALACAREDYLRFCDPAVMGTRIDRNCDTFMFSSAADVFGHLPAAMWLGLFAPYPNMWLEGFGSGGTGLRRLGYVTDGVLSYLLLPGLLALVIRRAGAPSAVPLLIVAAGLLAMVLTYGLAVPTQFILARMRLAFYLPLLVLGAAGWQRIFSRPA